MKNSGNSKKAKIIGIVIFILVILGLVGLLAIQIINDKNNNLENAIANTEEDSENQVTEEPEEVKQVEIFSGNDRPIAVMIDNHKGAWPQAGLNEAYLVYEIIVEGGETRLMALFKGVDLDNIGPVRSSRHYFLDYALENDAIYVHYGWSPQAKSDISTYSVNNINGIYYDSPNFRRITGKSSPHNVMTSTDKILSIAKSKGYATTSSNTSVLNYVTEEINLGSDTDETETNNVTTNNTSSVTNASGVASTATSSTSNTTSATTSNAIDATSVTIPHSTLHKVQYKYDAETKRYTRYARGVLQKDYYTGESFTTKNIIVVFMNNSTLNDGSGKGRQTLSNIGTFNGYYITNGKAIKITCTKNSRTTKTIYKDLDGNILNVNDGNTWINICPKSANVVIE